MPNLQPAIASPVPPTASPALPSQSQSQPQPLRMMMEDEKKSSDSDGGTPESQELSRKQKEGERRTSGSNNNNNNNSNQPQESKHETQTSSSSLPTPAQSAPSTSQPMMTNAVPMRPPSSASVHSNSSSVAAAAASASSTARSSTTATSRRGGRTRSRSPPMMMSSSRPPSTGPGTGIVVDGEPYGAGMAASMSTATATATATTTTRMHSPMHTDGDHRRHPHASSAANPSAAAAAAAAAAAKSLHYQQQQQHPHHRPHPSQQRTLSPYPPPSASSLSQQQQQQQPSQRGGPPPGPSSWYESTNPHGRESGYRRMMVGRGGGGAAAGGVPPGGLVENIGGPRYHPRYYDGPPPPPPPSSSSSRSQQYPPHQHQWPVMGGNGVGGGSTAAAAVAAAGGIPPPSPSRPTEDERGRPPSRTGRYPGRRPGPENPYAYRDSYAIYRGGPPVAAPGGRGGGGGGGRRRLGGDDQYASTAVLGQEEYAQRRYMESRFLGGEPRPSSSRTTSPMPSSAQRGGGPAPHPSMGPGYDYRSHHHHHHHRRDMHSYHPGEGGFLSHPGPGGASGPMLMKRTTRIIGGPTPIHMPRATTDTRSRSGSQSDSIFRGRPGSSSASASAATQSQTPKASEAAAEDNTQKVLMSLQTPSNSFEEKEATKTDAAGAAAAPATETLSPEAPPQIQHSHQSDAIFDPQRSPKSAAAAGPPQPSSSIDMAPSFNLFNQSFDSLGDTANFFNVSGSGALDSTLQSTSFGVVPTPSKDETTELHLSASVGNFSQQLLGGSTFEMSPNNSFGNGNGNGNGTSMLRSRSGNMMVLGGGGGGGAVGATLDRPPSPVSDMYRSYPAPGPNANHRTLAAPTLANAYNSRPYGGGNGGNGYYRGYGYPETDVDGRPGFYIFLNRHKNAFKDCSFLLPGLKDALLKASSSATSSSSSSPSPTKEELIQTPKRQTSSYIDVNPEEIKVARRRIVSAVCAFGGTFMSRASKLESKGSDSSSGSQSIFRKKVLPTSATVTPNSSASTSPSGHRSNHRAKYEEVMPSRYYENDNRLSWEFEETPPIDEMGREEEEADEVKREEEAKGSSIKASEAPADTDAPETDETDSKITLSSSKDGDNSKMKYRCKLCGQPKQNHTCPYQQSLARSIGTMIYPAMNAFAAVEPGSLAPALSEMNNFVSGGDSVVSNDGSPSRPTRASPGLGGSAQVTPETLRGTSRSGNSPTTTPVRSRTPPPMHTYPAHDMQRRHLGGPTPGRTPRGKKRGHGQISDDQGDLLFVDAVELKPEQYRIVTPSKIVSSQDAFTYPPLPLPYAQRKRLSDNLFSLSKEVPQLTDECAAVLREAREKDMWDLAVAELMTQVVVVVHCHEGDSRFEGLQRYLMTLGVSC